MQGDFCTFALQGFLKGKKHLCQPEYFRGGVIPATAHYRDAAQNSGVLLLQGHDHHVQALAGQMRAGNIAGAQFAELGFPKLDGVASAGVFAVRLAIFGIHCQQVVECAIGLQLGQGGVFAAGHDARLHEAAQHNLLLRMAIQRPQQHGVDGAQGKGALVDLPLEAAVPEQHQHNAAKHKAKHGKHAHPERAARPEGAVLKGKPFLFNNLPFVRKNQGKPLAHNAAEHGLILAGCYAQINGIVGNASNAQVADAGIGNVVRGKGHVADEGVHIAHGQRAQAADIAAGNGQDGAACAAVVFVEIFGEMVGNRHADAHVRQFVQGEVVRVFLTGYDGRGYADVGLGEIQILLKLGGHLQSRHHIDLVRLQRLERFFPVAKADRHEFQPGLFRNKPDVVCAQPLIMPVHVVNFVGGIVQAYAHAHAVRVFLDPAALFHCERRVFWQERAGGGKKQRKRAEYVGCIFHELVPRWANRVVCKNGFTLRGGRAHGLLAHPRCLKLPRLVQLALKGNRIKAVHYDLLPAPGCRR